MARRSATGRCGADGSAACRSTTRCAGRDASDDGCPAPAAGGRWDMGLGADGSSGAGAARRPVRGGRTAPPCVSLWRTAGADASGVPGAWCGTGPDRVGCESAPLTVDGSRRRRRGESSPVVDDAADVAAAAGAEGAGDAAAGDEGAGVSRRSRGRSGPVASARPGVGADCGGRTDMEVGPGAAAPAPRVGSSDSNDLAPETPKAESVPARGPTGSAGGVERSRISRRVRGRAGREWAWVPGVGPSGTRGDSGTWGLSARDRGTLPATAGWEAEVTDR